MKKTMPSESLHRNRNMGTAVAVIAVIIIALAGGLYFSGILPTQTTTLTPNLSPLTTITPTTNPTPTALPSPTPTPSSTPSPTSIPTPNPTPIIFDYHLDVSPTSGTVLQENSIQATITITLVQGSPENVTLSASVVPDGPDPSFSQTKGTPTNSSTFNSTLTIYASGVASNVYSVNVTATADNGKTYSMSYTISVLNSMITVSGTVSTPIKGVQIEGAYPTQIQFEQFFPPGSTHTATVQYNPDYHNYNYTISLPNKTSYSVSISWESSDGSSGIYNKPGPFPVLVFAGVGVTSMFLDF